ncbi:CHC2 zinc finger domain-containing protein [Pelobacter propionicus]|uniref:Zinc finger, CHC2-family protein n=1 Tax=Pelobacter propionicus (strain DSM 2379 / NBRC 103807 / OttBd1) TaxID=338966 RepID=A1AKI1_PELPD|nr:CHC2 zinc finger domain-containing protein [Pelobacter propionicus]ABK97851.1 zinc finger, CHC2-family protein [Pelobacter propionicus DSM 2379]
MTLNATLQAARDMGVPERYAVMRRLSFLQPQIKHLEREIWGARRRMERSHDPLSKALTESFIRDQEKELRPLKREAKTLLNHVNGKETVQAPGGISPEMIDQARQYPITSIIEFSKGRYRCCPFHEDRNPSMALYENHVHCFVCNRTWDSISATMALDGVTFREAVLALQS